MAEVMDIGDLLDAAPNEKRTATKPKKTTRTSKIGFFVSKEEAHKLKGLAEIDCDVRRNQLLIALSSWALKNKSEVKKIVEDYYESKS